MNRLFIFIFLLKVCWFELSAQSEVISGKKLTYAPTDADSLYIRRFVLKNDVRLMYGSEASSLAFGSDKEGTIVNTDIFNNVSDLFGLGLTYKFFDADISFSLPKTRILEEDRQNLQQLKLILSTSRRRFSIRGFYSDTRGIVSVDENSNYKTGADVQLTKLVLQVTCNFNYKRYSYRASNFQSELQTKSAAAFLLRFEPSYRYLKAPEGLVIQDTRALYLYGQQAEIRHINAPGLLVMPGLGWNARLGSDQFFFSPIVMAGPGFAVNTYNGYEAEQTKVNYELSGNAVLNTGYNGERLYATLRLAYDAYYSSLEPSYLTQTNFKVSLTLGYRFANLEKLIPDW